MGTDPLDGQSVGLSMAMWKAAPLGTPHRTLHDQDTHFYCVKPPGIWG